VPNPETMQVDPSMRSWLLEILACPYHHIDLDLTMLGQTKLDNEISEGVLRCPQCQRWFPISEGIPELLPDHLRSQRRDSAFLEKNKFRIPSDLLGSMMTIGQREVAEDRSPFLFRAPSFYDALMEWLLGGKGEQIFDEMFSLTGKARTPGLLLDVGCGDLLMAPYLIRRCSRLVGLELSANMLEKAKERQKGLEGSEISLVLGDAENLPFQTNAFDIISMVYIIHHVNDKPKLIEGALRTLKEQGVIVAREQYVPKTLLGQGIGLWWRWWDKAEHPDLESWNRLLARSGTKYSIKIQETGGFLQKFGGIFISIERD
jgi:SAM-dependent methyltransferase/uncharacterized protein YbaR (Trm112 family)